MKKSSSRDIILEWIKLHPEFDCEIEPDRLSPNWLCTLSDEGESYVLCIEQKPTNEYLVLSNVKFPETEEEKSFHDELKIICHHVNSQFLGVHCQVQEEYGIGVLFYATIPVRYFVSLADEDRMAYIQESITLI